MSLLNQTFLGNSVSAWATAFGISVLSLVILAILKRVAARRISALSARTANEVDDLVVSLLQSTRTFFTLMLSIYVGSLALELPSNLTGALGILTIFATLLQVGFWGSSSIRYLIQREVNVRLNQQDAGSATALNALGFIGQMVLWAVLLLLALDNAGVEINTLVASLGIGGIAVALALQNILSDLFAALSIVIDKPFVIGNSIVVQDFLGNVEKIGLKSTRIRSLSGEELIFSNSDLLNSRIRNYKTLTRRRIDFSIGVTYDTPYEKVAAIPQMIHAIIDAQEKATYDRAHFKAFGDYALNFEVVFYVEDADFNLYMDIQQCINLALYQKFEQEGIEFAFPTQTLFVEQNTTAQNVD